MHTKKLGETVAGSLHFLFYWSNLYGYLFSFQHEGDYFVLEATGPIYLEVDSDADK